MGPEVGDPSANLINNTKEVSSTSSGAKNVDISSKSGLTLWKLDPKSKDPKDESLVGETKDEDKEKEEVSKKNKEVSEIGSNIDNNSMSKVNICKADDTSTVTVTSTSLETTKHQNSLEHKTPLLVINNSTQ